MATWRGSWRFSNVMHSDHGKSGVMTVSASSEEGARNEIQQRASREVGGSGIFKNYIQVSGLTKTGGW